VFSNKAKLNLQKRKYRRIPGTVEAVELSFEESFFDAMLARSRSITFVTDNQIIII